MMAPNKTGWEGIKVLFDLRLISADVSTLNLFCLV